MSIIWTQPNGQISITTVAPGINETTYAAELAQTELYSGWTYSIGDSSTYAPYIAQQNIENIKQQILTLEMSITPRMIRESMLGISTTDPKTGLTAAQTIASVNTQITALRAQL